MCTSRKWFRRIKYETLNEAFFSGDPDEAQFMIEQFFTWNTSDSIKILNDIDWYQVVAEFGNSSYRLGKIMKLILDVTYQSVDDKILFKWILCPEKKKFLEIFFKDVHFLTIAKLYNIVSSNHLEISKCNELQYEIKIFCDNSVSNNSTYYFSSEDILRFFVYYTHTFDYYSTVRTELYSN